MYIYITHSRWLKPPARNVCVFPSIGRWNSRLSSMVAFMALRLRLGGLGDLHPTLHLASLAPCVEQRAASAVPGGTSGAMVENCEGGGVETREWI